jgi:hypothetical protein
MSVSHPTLSYCTRARTHPPIRHLATGYELLRVSERARDAAQDRVVLRGVLDRAGQAKVDWPYVV